MTLTFTKANEILQTLPVGYYLGRRTEIELSEFGDTSYCNMMTEKIVIAYPNIVEAAKRLVYITDDQFEHDVRCIVYHEISHLVLTPKNLTVTAPRNVFEDERIETVLKDYYMKVNFKDFVKRINDYKPEVKPTEPFQVFYNCVRFRDGKPEFVKRVAEIINKYRLLNNLSESRLIREYIEEIDKLYLDITNDFEKDKKEEAAKKEMYDGATNLDGEKQDAEKSDKSNKAKSDSSKASGGTSDKTDSGEVEASASDVSKSNADKIEDEKSDTPARPLSDEDLRALKEIEKVFKSVVTKMFKYDDAKLTANLEKIILTSLNKSSNKAKATNAHSGRLDVRSVTRDDYRWFVKSNNLGSANKFNKLKLNLFIDSSGSFMPSETKINQIIKSLLDIERKHKNFEFDVVAMGDYDRLLPKDKRKIECKEGNLLSPEIINIYKRVQTPNATVLNIVVFDGSSSSNDVPHDKPWMRGLKSDELVRLSNASFRAFNFKNTTIISDTSNMTKILKYSPDSKNIFTDDYAEELEKHVLTSLQRLVG